MIQSHFIIHSTGQFEGEPVVWIIDMGDRHNKTITNDAERVCEILQHDYADHRIVYKDSDGTWSELKHTHGVFDNFAPIPPELIPPRLTTFDNVRFARPSTAFHDAFDHRPGAFRRSRGVGVIEVLVILAVLSMLGSIATSPNVRLVQGDCEAACTETNDDAQGSAE